MKFFNICLLILLPTVFLFSQERALQLSLDVGDADIDSGITLGGHYLFDLKDQSVPFDVGPFVYYRLPSSSSSIGDDFNFVALGIMGKYEIDDRWSAMVGLGFNSFDAKSLESSYQSPLMTVSTSTSGGIMYALAAVYKVSDVLHLDLAYRLYSASYDVSITQNLDNIFSDISDGLQSNNMYVSKQSVNLNPSFLTLSATYLF